MMEMLRRCFLYGVLVLFSLPTLGLGNRGPKIELHHILTQHLNGVLKATNDLHAACIRGDERAIEMGINAISRAIQDTRQVSVLAKDYNRQHLLKILSTANSGLEGAKLRLGDARKEHLVAVFAQMVNLAKIYQTDPYQIFFCPRDKTLWLQKEAKPQNPFAGDKNLNCGVAVK